MIQITAYVRDKEDLKRWKKLPNKTEFLHRALNQGVFTGTATAPQNHEPEVSWLEMPTGPVFILNGRDEIKLHDGTVMHLDPEEPTTEPFEPSA